MEVQVQVLLKLTDHSVLEIHGMLFFWLKTLLLFVSFLCGIYQHCVAFPFGHRCKVEKCH